jgi:hypothetical protein
MVEYRRWSIGIDNGLQDPLHIENGAPLEPIS